MISVGGIIFIFTIVQVVLAAAQLVFAINVPAQG
jgi:hypothetical protein